MLVRRCKHPCYSKGSTIELTLKEALGIQQPEARKPSNQCRTNIGWMLQASRLFKKSHHLFNTGGTYHATQKKLKTMMYTVGFHTLSSTGLRSA